MNIYDIYELYRAYSPFMHVKTFSVDMIGSDGDTLLHVVSMEGSAEAVRVLLQAGANPNIRGDLGRVPLHNAVSAKSEMCVDLLLRGGASKIIKDEDGYTPEELARVLDYKNIASAIRQFA
ncbi:ankyrin repeat domain-containing protein [Caulobacter endophyticus]|uniref:Ankyrin repeat domain-containing protein n=1 Tax=Caulobacter endophyticus TaxID=2172652 RepID=A0A2T9JYJ8_9CAUL|nr:ankyrin repeat domain-containing protein [Caulobacter endophyticus]PVM88828.1 ankyrin repeat domain-containing protein [Caulobacter endophyticus]